MDTTNLIQQAQAWIRDDVDPSSQEQLRALIELGDEQKLRDCMAGPLVFGTAGLRGVIGAGPNRMNRAVVIRTTAGLGTYLRETVQDARNRGVVIGHDARRMSREFAEDAARVLLAAGFKVFLYPPYASTPLVAFATKHLGVAAGIMVTASHNPPEYNGYKVYWGNGAQIIPPHDKGIAAAIDAVGPARDVPVLDLSEAIDDGRLQRLGQDIVSSYLDGVNKLGFRQVQGDLRVVYTPMHGVGLETARAALERAGVSSLFVVAQQAQPDGEFPTVKFPNPEEPGALDLALQSAAEHRAHIVIANDPDADRLAVAVPKRDGDGYVSLSGNQVGVLFAHYLLTEDPKPSDKRLVVTTIVSSPMLGVMAQQLGVGYEETLTGFKWIANRAIAMQNEARSVFVTGYEEALGYTIGELVRDKDGVGAAKVMAELTSLYRARGKSLLDVLDEMYRSYGLFVSRQVSQWHRGLDGRERIDGLMDQLRGDPLWSINGEDVIAIRDYERQVRVAADRSSTALKLPVSNVLAFELSGGSRVIVRPSGTEPKIKLYFDHREQVADNESVQAATKRANERVDQTVAWMMARLDT